MRHRLRVSLYDEYRVDAALLDYLESLPDAHRSALLQRFVRVGFQMLIESAEIGEAHQEASLPSLNAQASPIATPSAGLAPAPVKAPAKTSTKAPAKPLAPAPQARAPDQVRQADGPPTSGPQSDRQPPAQRDALEQVPPSRPEPGEPDEPDEKYLSADPVLLLDDREILPQSAAEAPPSDPMARMKNRARKQAGPVDE